MMCFRVHEAAKGTFSLNHDKSRHRCLFAPSIQIVVGFDTRKILLTDNYYHAATGYVQFVYMSDKLDLETKI